MSTIPPTSDSNPPAPVPPPGTPPPGMQPGAPTPAPEKSKLGLIALIVAIVGFIFSVIPGALIIGWILLPVSFILSIVALFQKGKKTKAIIALIITIVGFVAGAFAFLWVVDDALTEALDELSTETEIIQEEDAEDQEGGSADQLVEEQEESEDEGKSDQEDASPAGTRENPLALGEEIVAANWTVVVNSVDMDATEEVVDASMANSEPADGNEYLLANLTATYTGEDKGNTLEVSIAFVSDLGEVYKSSDTLVVAPEPRFLMDELYTDASDTGNVAIEVPVGSKGVMRVTPGLLADEVFVSID